MTLNDFLEAIAAKITSIFPDKHVFVNEIPRAADGNFYVRIIEASRQTKLGRQRKGHIQFEVLYFLASKNNIDFNEWSEKMMDEFEKIDVRVKDSETKGIYLRNLSVSSDGDNRLYRFLFDADFDALLSEPESPAMLNLNQTEVIK